MIELSPEIVTAIMLGCVVFGGVLLGYPFAITVGAIALIMGYLLLGANAFNLIYMRIYDLTSSYIILAVPLFIFMGNMLEQTGIAEKMYAALYIWLGSLRGGLAVITVLIGAILAACVGIVGASVTMLSIIALPAMLNRGYDKSLATGAVAAGGTLGTLIPPSILLIIYGPLAQVSVGKLFFGAFLPGFLLAGLYCTYIVVRCLLKPELGPPVSVEGEKISFTKKTAILLKALAPPALLIIAVLGSIFLGIAPPTEAAAVGAFATTIMAMAYRVFSFKVLKDVAQKTLGISGMIYLIGGLSYAFIGIFLSAGAGNVVADFILTAPVGRWGAFAVTMLIIFMLGFVIDNLGIIFIMVPIIAPVAPSLGFDPVWFGLMVIINLQMSYMTPPMAVTIFYIRSSAPPELGVTTVDIIRGIVPFVGLIFIVLFLCTFFPQIILWFPSMMIK